MSFWDFVPALITAGATIYGANQVSKANNQATKTLDKANTAATNAELAGLEAAKTVVAQNQKAASPGLIAQQKIVNRGSALTPEQEMAVEDSRRQALNALQGGSLRGSARATSAILADTDKRVRNNFMTANQQQADQAAGQLSGQYFSAGDTLAGVNKSQGETVSNGLINSGNINSNNIQGQADITGKAIGSIGALIADQVKNNMNDSRDSHYKIPAGGA